MDNLQQFDDLLTKSLKILEAGTTLLRNSIYPGIQQQPIIAIRPAQSNYVTLMRENTGGSTLDVRFRYRENGEDEGTSYSQYPGGFKAVYNGDLLKMTGDQSYINSTLEIVIDQNAEDLNKTGILSAVALYTEMFVSNVELLYNANARQIDPTIL